MKFNLVSLGLAAMVLAGTGLSPSIWAEVAVSDGEQISAVVESVNLTTRHVLLRGP
jgi:hypothetical protein